MKNVLLFYQFSLSVNITSQCRTSLRFYKSTNTSNTCMMNYKLNLFCKIIPVLYKWNQFVRKRSLFQHLLFTQNVFSWNLLIQWFKDWLCKFKTRTKYLNCVYYKVFLIILGACGFWLAFLSKYGTVSVKLGILQIMKRHKFPVSKLQFLKSFLLWM